MKLNFALLYLVGAMFAVEVMDGSGAGFATVVGNLGNLGNVVSSGDGVVEGNLVAGNLGGAVFAGDGYGLLAGGLNTQNINLAPRVVTQRVMGQPRVITEQKVEPVYQRIVNQPMIERERFEVVPQYVNSPT